MAGDSVPDAEETKGAVGKAFWHYFREFGALKECGREFWVVQLVNLLDGVAYFAMLTVSTLYLSETLGYNDKDAANLWAACMAVYTGVGFVAGFVGDSLGIKRTLHLSVVLLVVSRLAVSLTTDKIVVLPALFVIAIGTAIMTPILISATKRHTTPKSQTAGFNVLYFLMNIGAFLGNVTLDPLRSLQLGNRSVFMVGSAMSILCWLSILLLWRRPLAQVDAQAKSDRADRSGDGDAGGTGASDNPKEEKWEAPWTIAASVFRESAFWRFMLFLVILVGVRLVFEHQYQVYPKYYIRTMSDFAFDAGVELQNDLDEGKDSAALRRAFEDHELPLSGGIRITVEQVQDRWRLKDGEQAFTILRRGDSLRVYRSNVPVGALNSINPLIICLGVIISTPIVARFTLFTVMFFGITVSAFSMLFLLIHPAWFCGQLGLSLTGGYRLIIILQIICFSLGEVIWSPRLYEYTAAIAPQGREASYMGLSYAPMFFARFAEGPLAGSLLTSYCPPDITDQLATVPYRQSPQFMCVILAALAITTPVLIVLLRGVIQKGSRLERDEQLASNTE